MAILQIGTAPEAGTGALEASFRLFMRLVALSCLVAGLQYWGRLIGLSDGGMSRFDLIPSYWQFASAALSVLLPVAAVGLWMQVSWGPVIWVVAAGSEIVMHKGFPLWYGERPLLVIAHVVVISVYIGFRAALFIKRRQDARLVRTDSL
ncbi:MAG: hypothetical protein KUA43_06970 [Hoeflea sp.]|uniref:DUF6163 family protein n=1 Tax=Hoeflea sp. TaxID=1940281 RepID=UPI001D9678A1|nr:DUF6163 family protein [Hoeflea sp.]MBU4530048.1 hypothetical protein [Alphaproteobacteria bacterium]MBU4542667.1 hypothetical protein [Alphaproteobacteria bacterium]MBU4551348.1 hypothetical protein [Alphaproteobacteria bacterium]MBV1723171.1 hypothetical protein [Hoeflea sp.]MBV1760182.1 hypothetical protein [Hoeflea sp.]